MACLLINLALLFSSCGGIKNDTLPQSIKEIWVYDYFDMRGYTTASAYGQIIRLEEEGVSKFKLEQHDTDSLCRIMSETLPKKVFPTKTGQYLIFVEFVLEDGQKLKAYLARGAITVIYEKDYLIINKKNRKWLIDFIHRMYEEYEKDTSN